MLILHYTNTVMIPQHTGNRIPQKNKTLHHTGTINSIPLKTKEIYFRHPLTWTDIKPF